MDIKIINKSNNPIPAYETNGSAGMDLRAYITNEDNELLIINPGEQELIHTGIYIQLPQGYEAQVRSRSGLAVKYNIRVFHGVGTIDSDYRGEICVPLENANKNLPFIVHNGDRIAQLVISKCEQANLILSEHLDDTERADGGFGHSGIK